MENLSELISNENQQKTRTKKINFKIRALDAEIRHHLKQTRIHALEEDEDFQKEEYYY
jgi:hypothetical protein